MKIYLKLQDGMPVTKFVPCPNKQYIKRDVWTLHTWEPIDESSPYIENGNIYRDVLETQKPLYDAIQSGLTHKYAAQGYLPSHTFDPSMNRLKMDRIPWCVFVDNYCKMQIRDGLIHCLKFLQEAQKDGLCLLDFHPGQFAMHYYNPVYYDIGSISYSYDRLSQGIEKWLQWIGGDLKDVGDIQKVLEYAENFIPRERSSGVWDNYAKSVSIPDGNNAELKFIKKHIDLFDPDDVGDIGANKGRIAKYIANMGIPVLASDTSARCVEHMYVFSKQHNLPITALYWDVMVPPHICGYPEVQTDLVIWSSLSHHLQYAGHDFVKQEKVIRQIAKKGVLYEFIDSKDGAIKEWGRKWTHAQFMEAFKGWEILDRASPEFPTRIWYALKKK